MASLLLLAACKVDDSAFVPLVELGTPESSYLLEADGGKIDLLSGRPRAKGMEPSQ